MISSVGFTRMPQYRKPKSSQVETKFVYEFRPQGTLDEFRLYEIRLDEIQLVYELGDEFRL